MYNRKRTRARRRKDRRGIKVVMSGLKNLLISLLRVSLASALISLLAVGAYASYEKVKSTGYFKVSRVEVYGNKIVNYKTILGLFGATKSKNIFELDLTEAGKRLESHPWIEWVELQRKLPSTIIISVKERKPVIMVQAARRVLVDKEGVVLTAVEPDFKAPVPLITGKRIGALSLRPGERVDSEIMSDVMTAISELNGYRLFGKSKLRSIDVSREDRLVIRFTGSHVIVTTPRGRWIDSAERLRTVDYILRGKEKSVESINLVFANKVIVTYPIKTPEKRG